MRGVAHDVRLIHAACLAVPQTRLVSRQTIRALATSRFMLIETCHAQLTSRYSLGRKRLISSVLTCVTSWPAASCAFIFWLFDLAKPCVRMKAFVDLTFRSAIVEGLLAREPSLAVLTDFFSNDNAPFFSCHRLSRVCPLHRFHRLLLRLLVLDDRPDPSCKDKSDANPSAENAGCCLRGIHLQLLYALCRKKPFLIAVCTRRQSWPEWSCSVECS
mmetsp:Transcript_22295/g.48662  ORF Transcript_22295/g.48662 Transcript_22295/m.48662 type:complete len:216 (+) Transcript_22295:588-1235(+)